MTEPEQRQQQAAAAERHGRREELIQDLLGRVLNHRCCVQYESLVADAVDNQFCWTNGKDGLENIEGIVRIILESLEDDFGVGVDGMIRSTITSPVRDIDEGNDFVSQLIDLIQYKIIEMVPELEIPDDDDSICGYENSFQASKHSIDETLCLTLLRPIIWEQLTPEERRLFPMVDGTTTTNSGTTTTTTNSQSSSSSSSLGMWNSINYYISGAFNILISLYATMIGGGGGDSGSSSGEEEEEAAAAQDDVGISIEDVRGAWYFARSIYFDDLNDEELKQAMIGLVGIDGDGPLTRNQAVINSMIAKIIDAKNANEEQSSALQTQQSLRSLEGRLARTTHRMTGDAHDIRHRSSIRHRSVFVQSITRMDRPRRT